MHGIHNFYNWSHLGTFQVYFSLYLASVAKLNRIISNKKFWNSTAQRTPPESCLVSTQCWDHSSHGNTFSSTRGAVVFSFSQPLLLCSGTYFSVFFSLLSLIFHQFKSFLVEQCRINGNVLGGEFVDNYRFVLGAEPNICPPRLPVHFSC